MTTNIDHEYLKLALKQAKIRKGFCSPNPSVGAVLVSSDNKILSAGYHLQPGSAHAEIDALNKLSTVPQGATLYITLEPCCHWGRTPPCTEAIIKAGIKRVVYGYLDPNPVVHNKSASILAAAGIHCDYIDTPLINRFYKSYTHWHKTRMPFVTAKIAMSLNGVIADKSGRPIQITGPELQRFTHLSRKRSDAILTTIETIIHDDPELNARINHQIYAKRLYVLDSHLRLPLTSTIFKTTESMTVFHSENASSHQKDQLCKNGVRCIAIDSHANGLDLTKAIALIGQDGVHDLWVEAGGKCFVSLLENKLLQCAYIYIAPRWLDHGKIAFPHSISLAEISQTLRWRQFGNDVLCAIQF